MTMPSLSAKMLWLLLMVMPLGGANTSDQRVSTVAPPHRISHQQQRLHQLEAAQQHQQQRHHHLRHEQHLRAELEGNGNHQPPPMGGSEGDLTGFESQLPMQQHHLRHHNRHHQSWEHRVFPALRHQQHLLAAVGTSTPRTLFTTEAPTTSHRGLNMNHTRYFDRDGMNPPWAEYHTTSAPNWRQELDTSNSDEESDEDDEDEDEEYDYNYDSSSNAVDEELARQVPRYSLFNQKPSHAAENKEIEYDQSDELEISDNRNRNSNRHPSVANPHHKPAEKRNIFDWLFKQDKEKELTRKPHTTAAPKTTTTTTTTTTTHRPERQTLILTDANLKKSDLDKLDKDYSNEDTDSEFEDAFSNEQWNKIEHDHKLRQQKHQKELQALREKSRNTPLIRNEAPPSYNIESEESGNIISNNYLPGSSTRRKIELHKEGYSKKRFSDMNKLAQENVRRVAREAICRIPQKRCLLVQQDTSKEYWPRCAILHRCSEDSGCCRKGKICAAKSTHNVELYFFVYNLKDSRTVEKRTFVNHTECHCIERSNYNVETAMAVSSPVRATILSCTCPSAFEKVLQDDGQCRCDCTSSNAGCDSLKRGVEHFSLKDRKCIEQGRCMPPTCEYGHFMKQQGGCPKQHEHPIYSVMS
ncbi:hypothetical protein KR067_002453 [Drosophila pandora]|nr:hypothetical protein KR067_002453 [Drosophila pandora]